MYSTLLMGMIFSAAATLYHLYILISQIISGVMPICFEFALIRLDYLISSIGIITPSGYPLPMLTDFRNEVAGIQPVT
jgi:hypothetical protein